MMQHLLDHHDVVRLHGTVCVLARGLACTEIQALLWSGDGYAVPTRRKLKFTGAKILCEGPCCNMHAAVGEKST